MLLFFEKKKPKTAQSRFEGGPPVKSRSWCVKFTFFGEVSLVKFALQGINITLLGSLQPVDMKKNSLQLILK